MLYIQKVSGLLSIDGLINCPDGTMDRIVNRILGAVKKEFGLVVDVEFMPSATIRRIGGAEEEGG